jgi:YidC/Oxa1 family membrane protein insertase
MDNQRPFLIIALVFILFMIWQAWQIDNAPQPEPTTASSESGDLPPADVPAAPVATPGSVPAEASPTAAAQKRIRVVTDVLDLEIDTRGGTIVRADLPTYPVSLDKPDTPVRILDEATRGYVAQSGLRHVETDGQDALELAPTHHAVYEAGADEYRLAAGQQELRVPLTWTGANGVTVTKVFTFTRGDFLVDVAHEVRNAGDQPWTAQQYRHLRHGPADDADGSMLLYTFTGAAYYDDAFHKLAFDDMQDDPLDADITGGWAAMLQHYFLSAWIPDQGATNHYYSMVIPQAGTTDYIVGLRSEPMSVAPGETAAFHTQFYVGPKIQERLEEIAEGLDLSVDYGVFTIFAKPLFWLLELIHDLIGNWGWAIIAVTVLIKAVFYKLSATSYRSMAKMRQVQPKLAALKERYGDDKQRMNKELFDLYKKEKINPLGGCLPILVQIPVFIAFYWMLLEAVELRQAPWILWIQDLSTRDPYFVLPVLMGITMIIQHKLNPAPIDPVQQKIMMILPIVFTVFFAFFPAGLVLYWFVNSLLSITQQWYIMQKMEKAKA